VDEHRVVPQYRENEDKQIDIRKHIEREGRLREKRLLFNVVDNYYDYLPLETHE